MPFIGDGDIAAEVYGDRFIYGADLDPERVKTAQGRFAACDIRVANCDGWPGFNSPEPFAVADFDAYANPYLGLTAFWQQAPKAKKIIIFGTDGMRFRIKRAHMVRTLPDGAETKVDDQSWRAQYNFWWPKHARPYVAKLIHPYRIAQAQFYMRGSVGMVYWGIVAEL